MPKRFNDKQRSIFVKFHHDVTRKEILAELKSIGISSGNKISTLINRWVLEVPFWKEQELSEELSKSELVEAVHENFDMRRRPSRIEEDENE